MAGFTKLHDTWGHVLSMSGASGREWAVFVALARFSRKDGTLSRPVRDVANACGITEKQASNAVAALRKRVFPMGGELWAILDMVGKPSRGRTTVYRCNVPTDFSRWDMSLPEGKTGAVRHAADAVNATAGSSSKGGGNATDNCPECYFWGQQPIEVFIRAGAAAVFSFDGGAAQLGGSSAPLEEGRGDAPSAGGAAHAQKRLTPEEEHTLDLFASRYQSEKNLDRKETMLCTFRTMYPELASRLEFSTV